MPEDRRLKVVYLFFIDRVANNADKDGKIRRWLVEAYKKLANLDPSKRRQDENTKIECGKAHFEVLSEVDFAVVNDARRV